MKKHSFGFIGDRCNEIRKGVVDVGDSGFKRFSGFNYSVSSVRYWSVSGYSNKDGFGVLIRRVQYGGPDIQGRIEFSQI